jgi:glycosyltransferase involved in cell wall biosynthesis
MRIAQVAPLYESVPPKLYGGTERVVAHLSDELVRRGHEVVLFASGDSQTLAELVPCRDVALRLDKALSWDLPANLSMLARVREQADEFDILHFHIDCLHFPLFDDCADRTLTTCHGRQDVNDLRNLYRYYPYFPLVSVSDGQRKPMPHLRWIRTIHHGYPKDQYAFSPEPTDGYLAFLGRIAPEKGVDRAIAIAERAGLPLRIAAKIDFADRGYFNNQIAPLLKEAAHTEYVGEISEGEKAAFLGGARALLFPIDWPEPFGLVMIEAMACGTPVLAFRRGSVPEVIDDGVTGYVVGNVQEGICKMGSLLALDRGRVRRTFDQRFTARRMAQDYVSVYKQLQARRERWEHRPAHVALVNGSRLPREAEKLASLSAVGAAAQPR